ncbi:rhoptry neck protein 6, putative [Plasmodium ovale wallikeri]|uniref:Rhoptry neck protein 6, putative n=1 Tax=Plasmodium ovale wallikeri TaxID=864142 RepID=A0A1A8YKR3_PLAOA|nr:rhoptry neck protein 6, putative [Plasmodium ovale wallikeri]
MESSEILSEPVSMKLLHNEILFENIKVGYRVPVAREQWYDEHVYTFRLLLLSPIFPCTQIIMPGEYNLCIAQFYQQPEKEEMLANNASNKNKKKRKNDIKIMGIDTIGTLYVLPLPMKK